MYSFSLSIFFWNWSALLFICIAIVEKLPMTNEKMRLPTSMLKTPKR